MPERRLDNFHCHWITRGLDGKLYAENQGETQGVWWATHFRLSDDGTRSTQIWRTVLSRNIFTADRDGRLVFADEGRVSIRSAKGDVSGFRGNGRPIAGEPALGPVSGLVWGPQGQLYLADGNRVRVVGKDGQVRVLRTLPGTVRIWGLTVDAYGRIFVALGSDGRVLRIDPGKSTDVVARSDDGWHATGVAVSGEKVYLFETKLVGNQNLGPRVRVIESGKPPRILGTVER